MRTIGLIGGMSFESSAMYYRVINEAVRDRLGALHSAEIILHSVDFQGIVDLQKADRWVDAGQRLALVAQRLEQAGAECVLICTNTMHLVADVVEQAIKVPLIHVIDETAHALRRAGRTKPLLLGTRYTMEQGFYAQRLETHAVSLLVPNEADRIAVHSIIFDELCSGVILPASRAAPDHDDRESQACGRRCGNLRLHGAWPDPESRRTAPARLRFDRDPLCGGGRFLPGAGRKPDCINSLALLHSLQHRPKQGLSASA